MRPAQENHRSYTNESVTLPDDLDCWKRDMRGREPFPMPQVVISEFNTDCAGPFQPLSKAKRSGCQPSLREALCCETRRVVIPSDGFVDEGKAYLR